MVRPFTLRDLALVRRLSEQGISLHSESALADEFHPLLGALASLVVGGKSPTFVFKADENKETGFVQLALEEKKHHAHVLYLSPSFDLSSGDGLSEVSDIRETIWLSLLDQAVREVGRLGIHSLVAETSETGPELPVLRRAGFAVYARQDIWILADKENRFRPADTITRLLPYLSTDDWDIQLLYANTVPQLVQLVEPDPPQMNGDGLVLRDKQNELVAFVHAHHGSAATWLRFFIHPSAEADAAEIVHAALNMDDDNRQKPVYCCVRRYEGWLPAALEQNGFNIWGSQAVLVKHTVKHTKRTEPQLAVNLEQSGMPVTSPFVGHHPDLEHYPIDKFKNE